MRLGLSRTTKIVKPTLFPVSYADRTLSDFVVMQRVGQNNDKPKPTPVHRSAQFGVLHPEQTRSLQTFFGSRPRLWGGGPGRDAYYNLSAAATA